MNTGIINRYRQYMPVSDTTNVVTLHEGSTPLIPAPRLAAAIHSNIDLYLKYDGMNPTGSFKDRGMTLAVTKALESGMRTVMCASTGNTSASAAAYAARAGMKCCVLIPGGNIALGKLAQAIVHGAQVLAIQGNFDEALCLVREITAEYPVALVNSLNPFRLQGQQSAAWEIVDELGRAPDIHALPVGNAGNITAYWMGYKRYRELGISGNLPKMIGFQAEGAAPIVRGEPVAKPETIASAIRIGNPASWKGAIQARDESGGQIGCVSDKEILEAYQAAASLEGIFAEPASVVPLAGLIKLAREGYFTSLVTVVVTLTGHGLKDPKTAMGIEAAEPESVRPNKQEVLRKLGL